MRRRNPLQDGSRSKAKPRKSTSRTAHYFPSSALLLLDFRTVLVTFVGRPNDEIVSIRCTVVKSETNALMRQTPKSNATIATARLCPASRLIAFGCSFGMA
ncbi:BZ3500_MvSof-1268-A1-R1_Chr3-1g05807 [Microbotryum saponariae]|uniref:BZ3500_MvSof-1268-A1-R1_Chr3-1g05807 protein n=1 Tax=Microbotryum saponariae TaxID=289078 RepID=A0A2X0KY49_9BASI|nr:BZ3500_MvSof-1268-A1-R1_Chr3-1g05807 [Microbotryum saponariae]SDA04997.1 BZ3501_MvSof-1269-A2-R1_Chr3-1g05477 [Microbotryum saponariae]